MITSVRLLLATFAMAALFVCGCTDRELVQRLERLESQFATLEALIERQHRDIGIRLGDEATQIRRYLDELRSSTSSAKTAADRLGETVRIIQKELDAIGPAIKGLIEEQVAPIRKELAKVSLNEDECADTFDNVIRIIRVDWETHVPECSAASKRKTLDQLKSRLMATCAGGVKWERTFYDCLRAETMDALRQCFGKSLPDLDALREKMQNLCVSQ